MNLLSNIKNNIKTIQTKERYIHTLGVEEQAIKFAKQFNADEKKTRIAALLHDSCKDLSKECQKFLINDEIIIKKYENYQFIYHAYAAKNYAKLFFNINDSDILNAITNHVIGRKNMSKLEEIIFLSDYIEKNRIYDSCIKVRNETNFYKQMYLTYQYTIDYLIKNNQEPLKIQLELRDYYKGVCNE